MKRRRSGRQERSVCASAPRFSRSFPLPPPPPPERFRERASLVGRKLYFRSSIAFVRGEYPVSRARSVDYTLELHALIGNQSFCYPLRGEASPVGLSRVSRRFEISRVHTLKMLVKSNIFIFFRSV